MIASINQPAYLPWLGYFDRIDASDIHIVLDHVQFEKNSFVNRNKIRTVQGWTWLTIPISTKGRFGNLCIDALATAGDGRWRRKHWNAIRANYARASHFRDQEGYLDVFYANSADDPLFFPPIQSMNKHFLETLGIGTELVLSSELDVSETKSNLVLELCRHVGATTYLSGPLGRNYLDRNSFSEAGISVVFHDYAPQPYEQAWPGFEPNMAVIDVLANHGSNAAKEIMCRGRRLS